MADQVQDSLDRMVPALKDLLDREIFTETEIKAIVSRRRESEYLCRRIKPRKADYQRYIAAEKNLEKLRKLRKKLVLTRKDAKEREERRNNNNNEYDKNNQRNKKNKKGKNNDDDDEDDKKGKSQGSIGDVSIVQNIHLLFARAKRKWQSDLTWHLQHAEFAKEAKSFLMLGRIYSEALQLHPRNENLWIEAASHEYFGLVQDQNTQGMSGGGSIKSARVLLQRGLRINSQAKNLWLQSFCLELHYIQKLRGRREILKLKEAVEANGDDVNEKDEAAELEMSLKLPHIIYKNAIKAVPNDTVFRMEFIEQSKLFPQTEALIGYIMETVEKDFQNVEEAWIARAQFIVDEGNSDEGKITGFLMNEPSEGDGDGEDESPDSISKKRKRGELKEENDTKDSRVLQVLKDATDSIDNSKMFVESFRFLRWYTAKVSTSLEEDQDEIDLARERITKIIQFIVELINKAESKVKVLSPELAIEMATCLSEFGLPSQSLKLIKRLTNDNAQCRKDAQCWLKIADISESISLAETGETNLKPSCTILRKATALIPLHDPGHLEILSRLFMSLLATTSNKSSEEELYNTFEKILLLRNQDVEESDVSIPSISLAYLRFASMKSDIKLARKVYNNFLFTSNYCKASSKSEEDIETMKEFFDECLLIEKEDAKTNRMSSVSNHRGAGKEKQKKQIMSNLCGAGFSYFLDVDDSLANSYNRKRNEII